MAGAGPERFGTLTLVGDDWQVVRARMNRLGYELRRESRGWVWVWQVEPNPAGTGHHVHFWQRGRFVPQATLSRLADAEGMGPVADIRKWRATGDVLAYGVKLVGIGYGAKAIGTEDEELAGFLRVNGGRLVHASRRWWVDRNRQPCRQREAMAAWSGVEPDESGDWVLMREAVLGDFAAGVGRV